MRMALILMTCLLFVVGANARSSHDGWQEKVEHQMSLLAIENEALTEEVRYLSVRLEEWEAASINREDGPVAFSVHPTEPRSYQPDERIIFDVAQTNYGGGWNSDANEFSCPVTGLYLIAVSGTVVQENAATLDVKRNGVQIARVRSDGRGDAVSQGSNKVVVECESNMKIYVEAGTNGTLAGSNNIQTSFSGMLIR